MIFAYLSHIFIFSPNTLIYFPPSSHISPGRFPWGWRDTAMPQVDDRGGVGRGGHGAQAPHGQLCTSAGESRR